MAIGHCINLTTAEVVHILNVYNSFLLYRQDEPFHAAARSTRYCRDIIEPLMNNLARWAVLAHQQGRSDNVGKATAETWHQLTFPEKEAGVG